MSDYVTFQSIIKYRVKLTDGTVEFVSGWTRPIEGTEKAQKKAPIKKDFTKKSEDVEVEEW